MKKFLLLFLGVFVLMGVGCKNSIENSVNQTLGLDAVNIEQKAQKDIAEAKAKELFSQKANQGIDLNNGPCLAEEIIPDWSVDVAHNPRLKIDDQIENQCQNFRNGKTHHFIELDVNGKVINVK